MHSLKQKVIALVLSLLSTAVFAVSDLQFFAYAQANYPEVFNGAPVSGQYLQYHYAYFPSTSTYLAVDTAANAYVVGLTEAAVQPNTTTMLYLPNYDFSQQGIYELSFWWLLR